MWPEISDFKSESAEEICKQIIWNNKRILINNKSVYYKTFHEAGIVCFTQGWIKCGSGEHRSREITRKIEEVITLM